MRWNNWCQHMEVDAIFSHLFYHSSLSFFPLFPEEDKEEEVREGHGVEVEAVPVLPEEDKEEDVREGHGVEVEAVPVLPEEAIKEGHRVEVEEKKEDIDWKGDQSSPLKKDGESIGKGGKREKRCCEIL